VRRVRRLSIGVGFTEGPVITDTGEIVHVSIDEGRLYRIDSSGTSTVLADLAGGPNGACPGPGGEIYVAQNGGNWMLGTGTAPKTESGVQAVDMDGNVRWVTTEPLAPNDLCFGPDGALYITDPTRRRTYDDGRIWRYDPVSGVAAVLYTVPWFPNGIAFGLEEDRVYVASTGDCRIVTLAIDGSGATVPFVEMERGYPDGMAFDVEGNLLVGANSHTPGVPGDIQVFDRSGRLIECIPVGPNCRYTNLAISEDGTLVVSDSDGGGILVVERWDHPGLALHPRRASSPAEPQLEPGLLNRAKTHSLKE
jgi:gluconolactonase